MYHQSREVISTLEENQNRHVSFSDASFKNERDYLNEISNSQELPERDCTDEFSISQELPHIESEVSMESDFEASPSLKGENNEAGSALEKLKLNNINRLIVGHLNINSIRNKFEQLKLMLRENIDIIMISETKIDESFPASQFVIPGYSNPYRYDRNSSGGGLMIFIREDIACREITLQKTLKAFFLN